MSDVKKETEKPSEPPFKAEGKIFTQAEIVKVLKKLSGEDLDSTAIRGALKLDRETGRDRVRLLLRNW